MKRFFAVFIAFAVAFSFGNRTEAMSIFYENKDSDNVSVMSDEVLLDIQIELNSNDAIRIIRGEKQTVSLVGLYSDGVKKPIPFSDVKWDVFKEAVATISSGNLHALAPGETTIVARYDGLIAMATVQVLDFKELHYKEGDVPAFKIWNVKFSNQLDIQTVKENIIVVDSGGIEVPVRTRILNDQTEPVIQIIPVDNYIPGKSYTIWVKDIQSLSGKSLKHYTKMNFKIKK